MMDEWLEHTLPYGAQRPRTDKRQLSQPRSVVDSPQFVSEGSVGLRDQGVGGEATTVSGIGGDLPGTDSQQDAGLAESHNASSRGGDAQPEVVVLGDRRPVPASTDQDTPSSESGGMGVRAVEQQGEPTGSWGEWDWQSGQFRPGADDLERGEDEVGPAVDGGELPPESAGEADVVGVHSRYQAAFRLIEQLGQPASDPEVLGGDRELDPSVSDTADNLGRAVARRVVENQDFGVVGQGAQRRAHGGLDRAGGVSRRQEDAQSGHGPSISHGFVNPPVNPPLRATAPETWRRPVPRLSTGHPSPEGTPMQRTPDRAAPRHAPRVRIGCDVHPISEIAESIEHFGERYLARVFTSVERAQTEGPMAIERLAGRFAAKEAVLKVLEVPHTTAIPWQSIEVRTGGNGVPFVVLGGAAKELAEQQGISRIDISLSHDGGIAMAVAAAVPIEPPLATALGGAA